jgi:hypothetical protein
MEEKKGESKVKNTCLEGQILPVAPPIIQNFLKGNFNTPQHL